MTSLKGHFLIAPPVVADENFNRSLVLILQHDEEGAIGLITNRPTNSELDELWEAMTGSPFPGEGVLHVGGPVEGPVMVLHTRAEYSEQRVLSGVYVSSQKSNLVKLISKKVLPYRVFAGYAGWQPGQLEAEIKAGGWLTTPASACDIFTPCEDPWKSMCQRLGDHVLKEVLGADKLTADPELN